MDNLCFAVVLLVLYATLIDIIMFFSLCAFLIGEVGVRGGTGHRREACSGVSSIT
jgi:hypothetical protein